MGWFYSNFCFYYLLLLLPTSFTSCAAVGASFWSVFFIFLAWRSFFIYLRLVFFFLVNLNFFPPLHIAFMRGLMIAPLTYHYYGDYKIDESSFSRQATFCSLCYNPPWSRTPGCFRRINLRVNESLSVLRAARIGDLFWT